MLVTEKEGLKDEHFKQRRYKDKQRKLLENMLSNVFLMSLPQIQALTSSLLK